MGAIIQPVFTNSAPRLAADWFAVHRRDLATTVAAISNPIGIAIGQFIPTVMVDDDGNGMTWLLLGEACLASILALIGWFAFAADPPLLHPHQPKHECAVISSSITSMVIALRSMIASRLKFERWRIAFRFPISRTTRFANSQSKTRRSRFQGKSE